MMTRLLIETSNIDFQIGLLSGSKLIYRSDDRPTDAREELAGLLQQALLHSKLTTDDLSEIIVDVGPGGLTSTRSGIAFANGLAFALNIKIVEANALELMVLQNQPESTDHVIAARRSNDGNFFMGFFQDGTCQKLALGKPDALISEMQWEEKQLRWIGPYPKSWMDDPPAFRVHFVDLLSPGLDAFELYCQRDDFEQQLRLEAARPINERIR